MSAIAVLLWRVRDACVLLFVVWEAATHLNWNPCYRVGQEIDPLNGVVVFYNGGVRHSSGRNVAPEGYGRDPHQLVADARVCCSLRCEADDRASSPAHSSMFEEIFSRRCPPGSRWRMRPSSEMSVTIVTGRVKLFVAATPSSGPAGM